MSLYEKYGGLQTVTSLVNALYEGILASPTLRPYFDGVDMQRLMQSQVRFVSYVMGMSGALYDLERLKAAHAPLRVTDTAFDEVAALLHGVLVRQGVEPDDIDHLMAIVAGARSSVVSG